MSASREKKSRQEETTQGPTAREQKKQQEAAQARRSAILYRVVGAICVVLVAFLLVWNTGLIQRSAPAVTINGVKYTIADVQYYYNSLAAQYGLSSSSSSIKDYLLSSALEYMKSDAALADKAEAEGYTMSDEARSYLDSQIQYLDGLDNQKEVIHSYYGPYMTYDKLVSLLERQTLASDYQSSYLSSLEYSASDLQNYYKENKDSLDTYTLSQFVLQARVDIAGDEMTEEETAALEEAKAGKKAVAEEIQRKLKAGEDPAALSEEYADQLYSFQISEAEVGSSVNNAYSEWAFDSARKAGDVTLAEYDSGTAYNYYVALFEGRELDETPTDNVRHILIQPEAGTIAQGEDGYDDEQAQLKADAEAKAGELLAQFQAGEATEDAFAALARENSADTGSAANGGLIAGVSQYSSYVEPFLNWCLEKHQPGDTGIVESDYGYHIMYFSGETGPYWKYQATNSLKKDAAAEWYSDAVEGASSETASGIRYVG